METNSKTRTGERCSGANESLSQPLFRVGQAVAKHFDPATCKRGKSSPARNHGVYAASVSPMDGAADQDGEARRQVGLILTPPMIPTPERQKET